MHVGGVWLRFLRPLLGVAAALLAFATPADAAVPAHGRAWELVSAGETGGAQLLLTRAWSDDGKGVVFATVGPLPGAVSGEALSHNLATRTPSGWQSVPVTEPYTAPVARFFGTVAMATSADLSSWLWGSISPLLPGAPEEPLLGLYRRDPGGNLALIGSIGTESTFLSPTSTSSDLGHVALDLTGALVPADSGRIAGRAAYEVAGNELRLAGVEESGAPPSPCGSVIGDGSALDQPTRKAGISRDGSRVFFTSPDPNTSACAPPTAVYLREDGAHTIAISASRCTRPDCNAPADVAFAGATGDGSSAYLLTAQQLTDDDVDAATDLYRYDRETGSLTRVSAGPTGTAADVISPIRAADHGHRVYFRATASLVPGQSTEGTGNLYFRDGGGPIHYLGNVSGQSLSNAAISADGGALLFEASLPLLPSDTDASADVYRYDALTSTLLQVSAGSDGRGNKPLNARIPFIEEPFPTQGPNTLSADGARAFFATTEALLAEDEDEELDVYEWTVGGGLGLLTPGAKGKAVEYKGASADGSSVFFETQQSLVAEDRDGGEADLYAARLGGGFPPLQTTPECAGEACQEPLPDRLSIAPPASASGTPEGSRPRPHPRFGFRLGAGTPRRLATEGRGVAVVRAPAAGRVHLAAFAAIGERETLVAEADAIAWREGRVAVPFRLEAEARDYLDRHRRLRLRLVVRHSQATVARQAVIELRVPR